MTPDAQTILQLQKGYTAAVLAAGKLSPEAVAKLEKLRNRDGSVVELSTLMLDLLQLTNFRVGAVNWRADWDPIKRELRHNGVVVRLDEHTESLPLCQSPPLVGLLNSRNGSSTEGVLDVPGS